MESAKGTRDRRIRGFALFVIALDFDGGDHRSRGWDAEDPGENSKDKSLITRWKKKVLT